MDEIIGVKLQVDGGDSLKTVGQLRQEFADAVNDAKRIGDEMGRSSPAFKAAQDNANKIGSSLKEASAAAVKLGDGIGKTATPITGMRTQLRAALENLIAIQTEFGDISPQAQKAAASVAELRDRIKDANEVSSLFDPEKKFQAIVGVTQGIASGFAAAQGAMALFGGESKQVEQALLKVQAAMALAQGLSGVRASVEDFQRLWGVLGNISIVQKANAAANTLAAGAMRLFGVATTQTGVAFNFLKSAIISTGIGVLIVGIGVLVNKLIQLTSSTNDAADAQRKLNQEMSERANQFTDEIAEIYAENAKLETARAKAAGATEEEIADITRKSNAAMRAERRFNYDQQIAQGLDASAAKKALDKADTDNEIFELGLREKARAESERKQKEAADKAKAATAKNLAERVAAHTAAQQAEKQTADEIFAIQHTAEETELRALAEKFRLRREAFEKDGRDISILLTAQAIERGNIETKYAGERAAAALAETQRQKEANDTFITSILSEQDAQTQRENTYAEARKQIAETEAQSKVQAAESVSTALSGFAALAGEQTEAGKAFAAVSATIQAILGAQQAFTALSAIPIVGPALGVVAAAGALAMGIANVKKIYAVQVPGKGTSSGPTPSMSNNAPLGPQNAQPQRVSLDQQSINNMGNAAVIKTYVVESDISGSQDRMRRIQNAATFR